MVNNADKTIKRLDEILENEREFLLNGELGSLTELADEKERLLEALADHEAENRTAIEPIARKLKRNEELLSSALEGIRSVARKLAELRENRRALDTYDKTGRKKSVDTTKSSVEKRA